MAGADLAPADLADDQRSMVGSNHEVKIAITDFRCRAEADFVATHRPELD
ncbi:MAG: hypothetical protein LBO20_05930 [Bifidobacteriaceae bacterium]|nr:hypothetical protein [Bifidobacteriaceae bacterium]